MKKAILPFVFGLIVATGGFMVMSKVSGCDCFPKCICNPCNCNK